MLPDLFQNPLVQGGAFLGGTGALIASLRTLPKKLYHNVKNKFIYTLSVSSDDDSYESLEHWLSTHVTAKRTRFFRLRKVWSEQKESFDFRLVPGEGEHFVRFRNKLVWITNSREKMDKMGSGDLFLKGIDIRIFRGDKKLLLALAKEAEEEYASKYDGLIKIFCPESYEGWGVYSVKSPRSIESVILPPNVSTNLITDTKKFIEAKEWYDTMGIPYHRGYLLYGEPGNGKTSLILALASTLNKNIAILSLSNWSMDDTKLTKLLAKLPKNTILVIEDIDAIFDESRKRKEDNKLSFSGLLNALDGLGSQDGRILFMTTNHRDKIDNALIRPGRADMHVYVGNATQEQARLLFLKFFPGSLELAERFSKEITEGKVSMASIQEHLFIHRDSPEAAMETFIHV